MGGKHEIRLAMVALIAGLAWGYLRHRGRSRAPLLALLQGLDWFVASGGAAAVVDGARRLLEGTADEDAAEPERISHFHQVVEERTGTEG